MVNCILNVLTADHMQLTEECIGKYIYNFDNETESLIYIQSKIDLNFLFVITTYGKYRLQLIN